MSYIYIKLKKLYKLPISTPMPPTPMPIHVPPTPTTQSKTDAIKTCIKHNYNHTYTGDLECVCCGHKVNILL
jgi:hypothetical protein